MGQKSFGEHGDCTPPPVAYEFANLKLPRGNTTLYILSKNKRFNYANEFFDVVHLFLSLK